MDFFSVEQRRNPYPAYEQLRRSSALFHLPELDLWLILDYAGVKRMLNDHDAFRSNLAESPGRGAPAWLIFFDPPHHTRLRGLILRAFTPRMIAGLEPRIRDLSGQLLDRSTGRGEMDLAAEYSIPLPMMVIAGMIGIPMDDWARFRRWSDSILKLSYSISGGEQAAGAVAEYRAVTAEMNDWLPGLVEQRRAKPADDLLTSLVEAGLNHGELLAFVQLLIVGGQETTANLINNAILCLIENPGELATLRAHPELLPSAIEEVLRYRSPVQWIFRGTSQPIEMGGVTIPAGKLALGVIGSANRDPAEFADPDRFDIRRDPNPHVAFGHGIHFCLGAALSRLEARIALSDLLVRMESFELAGKEPWEPRQALHVHGPSSLPIRFTPRRSTRA